MSSSSAAAGGAVSVPIDESIYGQELERLVQSKGVLRAKGYTLEQLSPGELEKKQRCGRCYKLYTQNPWRTDPYYYDDNYSDEDAYVAQNPDGPTAGPQSQPKPRRPSGICLYHDGEQENKVWTCCGQKIPCKGEDFHSSKAAYTNAELAERWKFFTTLTTDRNQVGPRRAIVIDCEMGVSVMGDMELISLAAIDYFTGEVLINSLVSPLVSMRHYNTQYSGISGKDMHEARKAKACFRGRNQARKALYPFIGPDTIIIGHALENDLNALRLIHPRVVDTQIVASNLASARRDAHKMLQAQEGSGGDGMAGAYTTGYQNNRGLKSLAWECLRRNIQTGGHDALEDVRATRDLLQWHLVHVVPLKASNPEAYFPIF
ncbi:uncharacterized protein DNG_03748 [Cephalotrichum gorgonifer]|uniref:Exonuclease domain-containing protein n=1 Tax=Cephalotrichum gorgonifer TaxID=2041049 RepID=A0AAE8MUR1_9PEZI|nr:uncharacterized protein DNG_03748 [Cephalotrichum gorgonifer]